jgi:hypothetical protein
VARPVINTQPLVCNVKRAKEAQRVHMPVERTIASAGDIWPDFRQHFFNVAACKKRELVFCGTCLILDLPDGRGPHLQFTVRQTQAQSATALKADVETRLLPQFGLKLRPIVRRAYCPAGVGRHPQAFALYPNQREIAARCPLRNVALVEHHDAIAVARKPECVGQSHQAAAHHCDVMLPLQELFL